MDPGVVTLAVHGEDGIELQTALGLDSEAQDRLVSMTLARTSAADPGTLCNSTHTDSPGRPALMRGFLRRSDTSDINELPVKLSAI